MQQDLLENKFIAPIADICRQWQQTGQIEFSWYFEMIKNLGAQKLLLYSVRINSPFFNDLNKKLKEFELIPEYVITASSFCETVNIKEHLESGTRFTVLIYSPLSADFIDKIDSFQEYLGLFNFVIIARNDWNVRNTYRTIPYFMRRNLFVDFPTSIHESDPFYPNNERSLLVKDLKSDFLDSNLPSYCPNLNLHSELPSNNVSHFSKHQTVANIKPLISIIIQDSESLMKFMNSKAISENYEKFEIIITRITGEKIDPISNHNNIIINQYFVHPFDHEIKISEATLDNYSATQSKGDYLFFLSSMNAQEIENTLVLLLKEQVDRITLFGKKNLVIKKSEFKAVAGFDDLLQDRKIRTIDLIIRSSCLNNIFDVIRPYFESYLKQVVSFNSDLDHKIMIHKFKELVKENSCLKVNNFTANIEDEKRDADEKMFYKAEQAKAVYLSLYNATPKVAIEGHLAYLIKPINECLRLIKHLANLHGWKINPLRLRHFFKRHLWKIPHFFKHHLWRVLYFFKSIGWFVFHMMYPVRKVYYFLNYQYEKRALGIHQKPNPMEVE